MKRYNHTNIKEQEYREEFLLKSRLNMTNKKRDNVFALVVTIIFAGLLALSLLASSGNSKNINTKNQNEVENFFVPIQVKSTVDIDGKTESVKIINT